MRSMLMRAESPIRRAIRPALWLLVIVPAIVLVAQLLLDQLGAEPIEALEHASGKWTLRFLAGSLAITPLMGLTGWGWLVAQRRFLGLATFFWAIGHLSVYTVLDQFFDWPAIAEDILKRIYITLGMLAFVARRGEMLARAPDVPVRCRAACGCGIVDGYGGTTH